MQKGKVFSTLWKELKLHKQIVILVHVEDVERFKSNITKNKYRDVGYNMQCPSARLSFDYSNEKAQLTVVLSSSLVEHIPINKL